MLTNEFIKKHSFTNGGYTFTRWDCKGRCIYGVTGSIESITNYHLEHIEVKSDVIEVHYSTPVNRWDSVKCYFRNGLSPKECAVYALEKWLTWACHYNAVRMFTAKKGARSEKAFLKSEALKDEKNGAITPYDGACTWIIEDRIKAL